MTHESEHREHMTKDYGEVAMQAAANAEHARSFFFSRVQRRPTSKPMLARVAEAMFWMSRYVERAEHIARLVLVNSNMLMDLGELAPRMQDEQWMAIFRILRLDHYIENLDIFGNHVGQRVFRLMSFDSTNKNSLLSCLTRARENARSIRENISVEMWETLNTLYWSLLSEDAQLRLDENPQQIFQSVIMGSLLFQGVSDQTLPHGQGWEFIQLAKYLERIDMTCRIIDVKFDVLHSAEHHWEGTLRNIQWMAVLRSCASIEAYRRRHVGDLDPTILAAFLILDDESPRTIRYSVRKAQEAIAGIAAKIHPQEIDAAERILGRLNAQLEYAEMKSLSGPHLKDFLESIKDNVAEAAAAVQKAYFLH
ncbi:MAG: alpha-E domain-containing protein [Candidatus Obscuribacterales bacterium]|nr:alpha-E domain-containing protein [Candidatus Obscuribacterales bacterium]